MSGPGKVLAWIALRVNPSGATFTFVIGISTKTSAARTEERTVESNASTREGLNTMAEHLGEHKVNRDGICDFYTFTARHDNLSFSIEIAVKIIRS